ncbi:TPA: LysR family transcriptional regulator [Morganella morganii]|nr:LysR family transcriptional regulator [Morganella morganii]
MFSRKMKYFIELARSESLNEAADRVCITPSAMSQGLNLFESHLGFKVFQKKKQTPVNNWRFGVF